MIFQVFKNSQVSDEMFSDLSETLCQPKFGSNKYLDFHNFGSVSLPHKATKRPVNISLGFIYFFQVLKNTLVSDEMFSDLSGTLCQTEFGSRKYYVFNNFAWISFQHRQLIPE